MGNFDKPEVCCRVRTAVTKQITLQELGQETISFLVCHFMAGHVGILKDVPTVTAKIMDSFLNCLFIVQHYCAQFVSLHISSLSWSIKDLLKLSNLFKCKTSCHQAKFAIL